MTYYRFNQSIVTAEASRRKPCRSFTRRLLKCLITVMESNCMYVARRRLKRTRLDPVLHETQNYIAYPK